MEKELRFLFGFAFARLVVSFQSRGERRKLPQLRSTQEQEQSASGKSIPAINRRQQFFNCFPQKKTLSLREKVSSTKHQPLLWNPLRFTLIAQLFHKRQ